MAIPHIFSFCAADSIRASLRYGAVIGGDMNSLDGSMLIKWLDTRISATIRFKSDCAAPENADETPLLSRPVLC